MSQTHRLITPILIMGSIILLINFAIRASFGVFQIPIANEFGWAREEFSLALAIQNLAWGIGQPIFGAIADKLGDRKAIILGALVYAAGLLPPLPRRIRCMNFWLALGLQAPDLA